MASINVEKMSLKDLLELQNKVQRAIANTKERERNDVKQKIASMAANAGFSMQELFGGRGSGKGSKVAVKFRNPDNSAETWTGRGRQPRWLAARVAKGAKLSEFAIK